MLAIKLDIKSVSGDLSIILDQYTGLFYKIYNNLELSCDKGFIQERLDEFNLLDLSVLRCCVAEAKTKYEQHLTDVKDKENRILEITKRLSQPFVTEKDLKLKYKLINKLTFLNNTKDNNICFGGKALLRKITKLKQQNSNPELLASLLEKFHSNRKMGYYFIGDSLEKGNRKFNFDLLNNKIIFKPSKNNHFEVDLVPHKNKIKNKTLLKLQALSELKQMAITVIISNKSVSLVYDNEKLKGYHFDLAAYKRESKGLVKEDRNVIFKRYINNQKERQLSGKLINRYFAYDSNPLELGVVIADKINDKGDFKVIFKECISMDYFGKKTGKASNHKETIRKNNKKKYELKQIWKYIFGLIKHYKVAYFIEEDLNIKQKDTTNTGTEFNRKTKNLWHRVETEGSISKNTLEMGVVRIPVEPYYSSFIGNLVYDDYDPIAAALELMRRGITKYIKGRSIYPAMETINQEKLNYLIGENEVIANVKSFKHLYKILSEHSYRNKDKKSLKVNDLKSYKSKVQKLIPLNYI
jgi:hypothetical protein